MELRASIRLMEEEIKQAIATYVGDHHHRRVEPEDVLLTAIASDFIIPKVGASVNFSSHVAIKADDGPAA